MAKTELTVPPKDEFLEARPAHATGTHRGVEEQSASDIIFPRIVLCQSGTPQGKRSNPQYIDGLLEGQMFNSLTNTIYGERIAIVPIYFFKMRMMFKPIDEGGGVLCFSRNANECNLEEGRPCTHDKWGPDGQKPECMEISNWFCYMPATREQIVWSCKASGLKAARQLNSLTRLSNSDSWARGYEVKAQGARGPGGQDYFTFAVKPLGWVSEDTFKICEELYKGIVPALKAGAAAMDTTGLDREGDTSFNTDEM